MLLCHVQEYLVISTLERHANGKDKCIFRNRSACCL